MGDALVKLLSELLDGAPSQGALALNPDDPGLLISLARLSAAEASKAPANGGSSIAAHVDHLRYGLELLNRWSRGENPASDFSASWTRTTVSEEQWRALQDALRAEAAAWRGVVAQAAGLAQFDLAVVAGSVAHLAYHLGAIRQIDRSIRGPAAWD